MEKEKKKPKLVEGRNHKDLSRKINERNNRKITKTKSWFFEKVNKIDKPLARLIKNKERRIKLTKLELKKDRLQQTIQQYKEL